MSTKEFEEMLDYYAMEINYIIDDIRNPKQDKLFPIPILKRLESVKKDIENERDYMQKERWERIEDGSCDDYGDDDDDWEETTGIDPALGTYHA